MNRSIKVSDEVYRLLQKYQGPRESYSDVIARALSVFEELDRIKAAMICKPAKVGAL